MGLLGISAFTGRKLYTLTLYFLITGLFIVSLVFAQTDGGEKQGSINTSSFQFGDPVQLTPEEKSYLSNLGNVTMCVDPDWEPYESISEDGNHVGIAADLIRLIAYRSGIDVKLVPTKDWDESLNVSKEGKCLILSFLTQTPARDEWLLFTEPYFSDPNVIITRAEHDFIPDPALLINHTIALPSGTSVEERVRQDYPHLTIITTGSSEADTFTLVEEKKADMTLRSLTMAAYTIRKEGLFNLKISGQIPNYTNHFRIGVSKDQPMLRDILNRGISTLTPQEVQQIVNRHISIEAQTGIDYNLIFQIIIVFSILTGIGFLYGFQQKRFNKSLAKREEQLVRLSEELHDQLEIIAKNDAALRVSEEKFRLLIENSIEGICVVQDGLLKFFNPIVPQLIGYSTEEIKTMPFTLFIHPEDVNFVSANYYNRIQGKTVESRYRFRIVCKDGTVKWIEMNSVLIHWEERPAIQSFFTDITDRIRAEEEVLENEVKFISIFQQTPDPILITSATSEIIEVNLGFESLFGFSNDELSGRKFQDTALSLSLSELSRECRLVLDGMVYRKEMTFLNKQNMPFVADVSISKIVIRSEPCYLIQIHDIDEIRRAHDAVAQVNHKLNILSSITRHDILNRIMVTSFYSGEIKNAISDEKLRKQLDLISKATEEIRSLIEFTREYQDLGATAPLWLAPDNVLKIPPIQGLLMNVTLTSELGGLEIYTDRMLEKVLYNLIENSVRHGKDMTHISLSCHQSNSDMIISYEDDGGGIALAEKEKVFEKGFGKNTGLGLFLIREILSITGIEIVENGEPGKGVRFEIRVPVGKWRISGA